MLPNEQIDIRETILESNQFGQNEIDTIHMAISKGRTAEVRQAYQELVSQLNGGNSSPQKVRAAGITAYLLAQHGDAIELLSELESDSLAQYYRAISFLAIEQLEDAQKAFQKADKAGYDSITCKLLEAGCIRQAGDIDKAEELIRSIARDAATRAEYSYQMGCILSDRGDTFGALEYFERAVDMDPGHSRALFNLAQLNNQLGNDDDAIRLYEQMLAKPPMYMGALMNLGLLYEDQEQYRPAAFCFQRVLEAFPDNERARLYLKDIESSSDMYYDEDEIRRNKALEQVMQVPITDFELSARSRNCLERAGINSLGDLTETTEEQLLAGKNFGETSLKEIRAILDLHGLKLGQNVHKQRSAPLYKPEELSPEERAMHDALVTDLDLSVRARKCLSRLGISTIGELVSRSADELLSVRNFGVTSLNEIREKLGDAGIKLRGD